MLYAFVLSQRPYEWRATKRAWCRDVHCSGYSRTAHFERIKHTFLLLPISRIALTRVSGWGIICVKTSTSKSLAGQRQINNDQIVVGASLNEPSVKHAVVCPRRAGRIRTIIISCVFYAAAFLYISRYIGRERERDWVNFGVSSRRVIIIIVITIGVVKFLVFPRWKLCRNFVEKISKTRSTLLDRIG